MKNNDLIKEWESFAEMDYKTAKHLYYNMKPRPLEIICYHCQQAIEKLLKGALLASGANLRKTHDLGLLAQELGEFIDIGEEYIEMCDNLTPYGVKIRYPQELFIEEHHAEKALKDTEKLYEYIKSIIEKIN